MTNLVDLKKAIKSLSSSEKRELLEALEHDGQSTMIAVEEQCLAEGVYCPHCCCTENLHKFDSFNGKQRYRCKDCGRTFTTTSELIIVCIHKDMLVLEHYIECVMDGFLIYKCIELYKIFLMSFAIGYTRY